MDQNAKRSSGSLRQFFQHTNTDNPQNILPILSSRVLGWLRLLPTMVVNANYMCNNVKTVKGDPNWDACI